MSASEKTESAKAGQNPPATRHPARPGRLLSVVRGNEERALHLSPILHKIKDDGPALIDGEVLQDAPPPDSANVPQQRLPKPKRQFPLPLSNRCSATNRSRSCWASVPR